MLIGALEAGGTKMVCSIGNPEGGVLQRASFQTLTPDGFYREIRHQGAGNRLVRPA